MNEHDWQAIAPPEDNGIMCTVCFECKCCGTPSPECKGDFNWDFDMTTPEVQYADPEEVRRAAERIVSENQELLKRLADK